MKKVNLFLLTVASATSQAKLQQKETVEAVAPLNGRLHAAAVDLPAVRQLRDRAEEYRLRRREARRLLNLYIIECLNGQEQNDEALDLVKTALLLDPTIVYQTFEYPADNEEYTLLLFAIFTKNLPLLEIVAHSSDPNQKTLSFAGALHCLIHTDFQIPDDFDFTHIVRDFLMLHGQNLNPDITDEDGNTPLNTIMRIEASDLISQLLTIFLQLGASPNTPDVGGTYPLITAIKMGTPLEQALLIEYGADLEVTDENGVTARELIQDMGTFEEIKNYLIQLNTRQEIIDAFEQLITRRNNE